MIASADTTSSYDENIKKVDPDWKVVLPRRKRKNCQPKGSRLEQESKQQPWTPPDIEIDQERESKLMQKIDTSIKKLENSKFYDLFLNQIQNPEVFGCFSGVLGSEPNMNMVVYGIGSVESYEDPRLQLSLAILMRKKFGWIGNIEVFDPILSGTETRVLNSLGCSVITVNEEGRRRVSKPTLFFMPHCEAVLYHNLLQANWDVKTVRNLVLFGNSFEAYEHHASVVKDYVALPYTKRILVARSFAKEFRVKADADDQSRAFHESSWHFFWPEHDQELAIV
ncbi:protein SENSITIVITY TO RED LIGHT REDUCED 1 [Amaranthus tricolor]|uniref:protein SENSITIVITY TO RED LIGHT REDUCED 1 n=1 Tax=Amaranthus tricolor TaxID=29722 RepID=UPI00258DD01E|nr:protein SENSITIVITY TO RED LIGHT REDUCED 1 [Amaranthus tricolor]XP_057520168.1 protein SENSITIVITY TO RED LIGHT REDUCED 1 [Amaranthus tricolor]XP_057520169.1 protein SENSITIVITY TO RED LIGHT REDUCED 1 [Amaranthus tricolor]XP_057520170.1 protein SENSITIVITY TO RED LIGHT REDUCED 1 [Amaranthus tricolor]XP_057520171.1 protein SENSITIVITY TO RED LIGHT REDUCED 1 [Amaranthus tricolor]XP_057520172.1 protein SENSITIVITY TO RED LIGHT REDUCED 1 [Amaranthus tricolor]